MEVAVAVVAVIGVNVVDVMVGMSGTIFVVTFGFESWDTCTIKRSPLCVPLPCAAAVFAQRPGLICKGD